MGQSELPRAFGPYKLVRRLAAGGMAEVYVATTQGLGGFEKVVALKLIHPQYSKDKEFISMLVEEAKLSVLLNHQNVVQILDLGCIARTYFIVMEFVDGVDLHRLLKSKTEVGGALPVELTVHIVGEVCRALDYAHRCEDSMGRPLHIVHRDVSPQNVLISKAGEVKLADFGIAKAAHRKEDTDAGTIKGKFYYMSPEQAWGDPLDQRSDLFSTGVLLWEMLTGEMLHKEVETRSLLKSVREGEVPPPSNVRPGIPAELDQIVLRATASRREDRFQTAEEFRESLARYMARARVVASPAKLSVLVEGLKLPDSTPPAQSWDGDTLVESTPAAARNETQAAEKVRLDSIANSSLDAKTQTPLNEKRRNGTRAISALTVLAFALLCAAIYFRPSATFANLEVDSFPTDAEVYLDGRAIGKTPLTVAEAVEIGETARLNVILDGHDVWKTTVQPTSDTMKYTAMLSPLKLSVEVRTEPSGAQIFLDGSLKGSSPLTLKDLRWGQMVNVEAKFEDGASASRSVRINGISEKAGLLIKSGD